MRILVKSAVGVHAAFLGAIVLLNCVGSDSSPDAEVAVDASSTGTPATGTDAASGDRTSSDASSVTPVADASDATSMGDATPDADASCGDTTTNHDHCGACGHSCAQSEACFSSVCDGDRLVDVSAGVDSSCVVTKSGRVFCWGANGSKQLGADSSASTCSGSLPCSPKALEVVGLEDATRISVGVFHACAVRMTGAVACWGANGSGQLGHATGDDACGGKPCSGTPTDVVGLPPADPATQVSAGNGFTCALLKSGAVYCWGANARGTLGNTSLTPAFASTPVPVTGLQTGVAFLATSSYNGDDLCAGMSADRSLRCWGDADQWGIGRDPANACACYSTAGLPTLSGVSNFTAVALSDGAGVGLRPDGHAYAWGFTGFGVANGASVDAVTAVPGLPLVAEVAANQTHACARTSSGAVWCWGINDGGQLGIGNFDGETTTCPGGGICHRTAVEVPGVVADRIATGTFFTVAIQAHRAVAWGVDTRSQLGHASSLDVACGTGKCSATPTTVEGIPGTTN